MPAIVIDSNLAGANAVGQNGPETIRNQQTVLAVRYISFDGLEHRGQMVINKELGQDVLDWFGLAFQLKFPIAKVIPAVSFGYDDRRLMAANVSSGFNYRKIAGSQKLSKHAMGRAFDINPVQNPYIRQSGQNVITEPPGAVWSPKTPGTLSREHELVQFLITRGW